MTTRHKFLAGAIVVALAGTGILIASIETENDPVYGFTDVSCTYNLKYFTTMDEMEAYSDANNGWEYNSYIELSEPDKCVEVVRVEGRRLEEEDEDEDTAPGGGRTQPANPADNFTQQDADNLKSCWEEKAIAIEDLENWVAEATTAATWKIERGKRGVAYLDFEIKNGNLEITASLHTDGIAEIVAQRPRLVFNHLATYGQMHETVHIGQLLKIFNERGSLPEPYEYWQMEVDGHNTSEIWWREFYDDAEPPSLLPEDQWAMSEEYSDKAKEYQDLKKKQDEGTITDTEEEDMKKIAKWLQSPANLPQAEENLDYDPNTDLECD